MLAHVAGALGDLPAPIRSVAARTVELTITTPGHVTTVAAMVLPHDLAVTTKTIPRSALVTATMPGHINFAATWVGRDKAMGFTIVHLSIAVPALELAPLPANASVVAVAPLVTSSITSPRFAWANTSLGDPTLHANGVVSYLATQSVSNLDGFVDAVAIDANGRVVAVLSTNHFWYSAQFVARVANIVATGHGCHSSLGVNGTNAQGGGAQIKTVRARGASAGRLAPGDVVIGLNGHDIHTWNTLLTLLYLTPAQSVASISFTRDATTYHTVVRLACSL